MARNEWGNAKYPMIPGHEIVGRVTEVGSSVIKFKVGDLAGVGCIVASCRTCENCVDGDEQLCKTLTTYTYNSIENGLSTPTYGGYSSQIVVNENYILMIPPQLPLPNAAPLLCAGITTYSPLKRLNISPGQKLAVLGFGGLGHMALKIAAAMGAKVTVFSGSESKNKDAYRLGAKDFVLIKDHSLKQLANQFDYIVDTISAPHDLNVYLNLLRRDGTLVIVGLPERPFEINAISLVMNRRNIIGSPSGGIKETQEMLNYCAENNISSEIELISIQKIEEAFARVTKSDVRYRFVIDMKTLLNNC
jgi:uncharacterized zinc-type alcohol dehydrogenase-like protein